MKNSSILILVIFLLFCMSCSNNGFPSKFISADKLANETKKNINGIYGYYLQNEDGNYPSEMGQVLIRQIGKRFIVGFYQVTDNGYKLIGNPVEFINTKQPYGSVYKENDNSLFSCIQADKNNGTGRIITYVKKGKVVVSETKNFNQSFYQKEKSDSMTAVKSDFNDDKNKSINLSTKQIELFNNRLSNLTVQQRNEVISFIKRGYLLYAGKLMGKYDENMDMKESSRMINKILGKEHIKILDTLEN